MVRSQALLGGLVLVLGLFVVGLTTYSTINRDISRDTRSQATDTCGGTSESSCEATAGCTWTTTESTCAGLSESACTSPCTKNYNSGWASCSGSPPCNAEANCTEQRNYSSCSGLDRSACVSHSGCSWSSTCVGPSACSNTNCLASQGCTWSNNCSGSYYSSTSCVGSGASYNHFVSCNGTRITGGICTGTPTPTTNPNTCAGTCRYGISTCDPTYENASGSCSPGSICCGAAKELKKVNGASCTGNSECVSNYCSPNHTCQTYVAPTPIPTSTPAPTPYCSSRVEDDCAMDGKDCTPTLSGGTCYQAPVTDPNHCDTIGAARCNGNYRQQCSTSNLWENRVNCPNGCSNGNCIVVTLKSNTQSCTNNSECQSNNCQLTQSGRICLATGQSVTTIVAANGTCGTTAYNRECVSGYSCQQNQCKLIPTESPTSIIGLAQTCAANPSLAVCQQQTETYAPSTESNPLTNQQMGIAALQALNTITFGALGNYVSSNVAQNQTYGYGTQSYNYTDRIMNYENWRVATNLGTTLVGEAAIGAYAGAAAGGTMSIGTALAGGASTANFLFSTANTASVCKTPQDFLNNRTCQMAGLQNATAGLGMASIGTSMTAKAVSLAANTADTALGGVNTFNYCKQYGPNGTCLLFGATTALGATGTIADTIYMTKSPISPTTISGYAGGITNTNSSNEIITIYKGVTSDAGDILPRAAQGSKIYDPMNPELVLQQKLAEGMTLEDIAWQQSKFPLPDSPTTSWTTNIEVARKYANNYEEGGKIVSMQISKGQGISIPELVSSRGGISWPSQYSITESEYVLFGIINKSEYSIVEEFAAKNTINVSKLIPSFP